MTYVFRRPWEYAAHRRRWPQFTVPDVTPPTWSVTPQVTKNADGTISVQSTIADEKSPSIAKSYVILAGGSSAPASGEDVFNQENNAANPLFGDTQISLESGEAHTFANIGPFSSGAFDYYEAARDNAENYSITSVVSFTITLSLFVNVLPMRVVRHAGRYH